MYAFQLTCAASNWSTTFWWLNSGACAVSSLLDPQFDPLVAAM